jgi:hypothetical protein
MEKTITHGPPALSFKIASYVLWKKSMFRVKNIMGPGAMSAAAGSRPDTDWTYQAVSALLNIHNARNTIFYPGENPPAWLYIIKKTAILLPGGF